MKKLLALLLAVLMVFAVAACSDKDEQEKNKGDNSKYEHKTIDDTDDTYGSDTFYFENVDSETVVITKFSTTNDAAHTVTIPAYFEKEVGEGEAPQYLRVVGVAQEAFVCSSSVAALVFPTEAQYRERNANFDMSTHTFVIGDYAFRDCVALTALKLPAYVTEIGEGAFNNCTSLQSVTFEGESQLAAIKDYAFIDCISLKEIELPASVQTIGDGAFFECFGLESVIINEGTTAVGMKAFQNCKAMAIVKLPASLETIGKYAFHGSEALYEEGLEYAGTSEIINAYIKSLALIEDPKDEIPADPDAPAEPADPAE